MLAMLGLLLTDIDVDDMAFGTVDSIPSSFNDVFSIRLLGASSNDNVVRVVVACDGIVMAVVFSIGNDNFCLDRQVDYGLLVGR